MGHSLVVGERHVLNKVRCRYNCQKDSSKNRFFAVQQKKCLKTRTEKINFFPKMWYRKTPGLGRGEGEGITSPISLLTTSLPSIRMVTSSLALSQADDQIIFVKINYNN